MTQRRVELPIVKVTLAQGPLITEYLHLVGASRISTVNSVRQGFRPFVFAHKLKQYTEAEEPEKYDEMMKDPKVREKRFDSEYCRLRDFCESFHFASQQDNEVMLTYFGRLSLAELKKHKTKDFFGEEMKDLLGRVLIFVDVVDRWNILETLKQSDGTLTTRELARTLHKKGIHIDEKGVENRVKQKLKSSYVDEWKEEGHVGIPDYYWIQKRLKEDLEMRVQEEMERILVDLIRLYRHVGLVTSEQTSIMLNASRYEELQKRRFWNTSSTVKPEEFRTSFLAAIKKNATAARPNVPLSIVRDHVCNDLSIPWETFDHLTVQMKFTGGKETINFSHGRFQKKWGLTMNNDSYYYASLRKSDSGS